MSAGVNFVNNAGSRFKVALRGSVQQAGGMVTHEAVAHRLCRHQRDAQIGGSRHATYVVVQGGNNVPRVSLLNINFNHYIFMFRRRVRSICLQLARSVDDARQRRVVGETKHEREAGGPNFNWGRGICGHLRPAMV